MDLNFFGFKITRNEQPVVSFAPEIKDDGAVITTATGGAQGFYIDLDGSVRNEAEAVAKYREMALNPEIDIAIGDIVNEAICLEDGTDTVKLNLDKLEQPPKIKELILQEFQTVLKVLDFKNKGYDIFRNWYVDGRLYYHVIIDNKNPAFGIQELRYVDPRKIRKIRQVKNDRIQTIPVSQTIDEYYVYNPRGFGKIPASPATAPVDHAITGIKITKDSIAHITSGLTNTTGDLVIGYLHKAIKPLNQLKAMEDSLVIYRISRAPERRIFYIDVGNLPKMKAEQYLKDIMTKFKNKVTYDASSGEIRDERKYMTMLEDFWLPRREGGRGTEITTLPGGQNLGQIEDIQYFQNNLFKALNVPVSRLDPSAVYSLGRATEISRDEIKFTKFIKRMRTKFSDLFNTLLEKQLILRGIMNDQEWEMFKPYFEYKFLDDSHMAELKDIEVMNTRMNLLMDMDPFIGKYYSHEYVRKNILKQTEEEIEQENELIMQEMQNPILNPQIMEQQPQEPQPKPPRAERNKKV